MLMTVNHCIIELTLYSLSCYIWLTMYMGYSDLYQQLLLFFKPDNG